MRIWAILFLLLLAACAGAPTQAKVATMTPPAAASPTAAPTFTASPAPVDPTAVPVRTETPLPAPVVCSPLRDQPLEGLADQIANPFHPPAPGSDDPHHGVDLAIKMPGTEMAVAGPPVQAALSGRVAAVIQDRFPYGNAILIETPLEELPQAWQAAAGLPTPAPTLAPVSALTCPEGSPYPFPDPARRSLYVLYAHLNAPPALPVESAVTCGQEIGAVGQSGNALAPHLHFETRAGPAGWRLASMAHYDASASIEEMRNYCQWRISGVFQLTDPMQVLRNP